ncbi:PilZ domain-containing protein [Cellvibrio fontiphilus]|uniref:PilZ domain-containing protein n=1 Tax=Cellvibrio fontiphilus TaxID=1815559 RepID=A0ABV7FHF7_9GAMM
MNFKTGKTHIHYLDSDEVTNNEDYAMGINDKAYSEKRDFIRMKIGAPLNAKIAADSAVIEGLCLDLSGGGLQVEAPQTIAIGTEVDVEVSSDHGHNPTLKASAKVVRAAPSETGSHLLGLEIIKILP